MNKLGVILLSAWCLTEANASVALESPYRTAGKEVHRAFDEVRDYLQTGSAVFVRGREEIIFGTVVSSDGLILTKASELGDLSDVTVRIDRESYSQPKLLAVDPSWDVALVKVDAMGLVPVAFLRGDEPARGTWVVVNGATTRFRRRVQVGVVAASTREVVPSGGTVLGVMLADEGLEVKEVTEGGGAAEGGIKAGDVIRSVGGEAVEERKELFEALSEKKVGDQVLLEVERDGETLELEIELSARGELFEQPMSRNDAMSGAVSKRRTGFPRVMQHDVMGRNNYMGGPVFNLQGECVGMNIARFSRCETYAIPAKDLETLFDSLVEKAQEQ